MQVSLRAMMSMRSISKSFYGKFDSTIIFHDGEVASLRVINVPLLQFTDLLSGWAPFLKSPTVLQRKI